MSSVYKKLYAIMNEELTIKKSGFNKYHQYKYVTEGDILELAKKVFHKHKLVCIPNQVEIINTRDDITRIIYEFTLADPETGDSIVLRHGGDGQDGGDKGIYKASTGAIKYFLMKLLMVSAEDDPEGDAAKESNKTPSKKSAPPTPRKANLPPKKEESNLPEIPGSSKEDDKPPFETEEPKTEDIKKPGDRFRRKSSN